MPRYREAAVRRPLHGQASTAGRDPGDALEEAINLWCYFLKLGADPFAYRCDEGRSDRPHPAEQRTLAKAGWTEAA
jgi:hypothetical protein